MACALGVSPRLDPDTVDARFWALVGRDESWLDAEYAEPMAEPVETPAVPRPGSPVAVDRDPPRQTRPATGDGSARGGPVERCRDDLVRRQRSPPGCAQESRILRRKGDAIGHIRETSCQAIHQSVAGRATVGCTRK